MSAAAPSAPRQLRPRTFTGSSIEVGRDWDRLRQSFDALRLVPGEFYTPEFFLASISEHFWQPALILIEADRHAAGILYAKERKALGRKTGLFFADATLGSVVAAADADRDEAFCMGMSTIVNNRRFRSLRLLASPTGREVALLAAIAQQSGLEFRVAATASHTVLPLAARYENFLEKLSYKSRRNFRYFRNRSDHAGHVYDPSLSFDEFSAAALKLQKQATIGGDRDGIERALNMFRCAQHPLLAGLKSPAGEWLCLIGGWYEKDRVVIFMQLNSGDPQQAKFSLSLVARTHLVESVIQQKYREILWWAGVGEPISHYCTPVPSVWACVDSPGLGWRLVRGCIERHSHRLPGRWRVLAESIVSPAANSLSERSPEQLPSSSSY